ncbi:uncharacterized protein LOC126738627 [Anthonomus grandis grandis]|uniref:uncharacterized protein LOC126738627 n=1 Tax=Anthonomus grandis grandis TaxID=2921223 RepID=UPI002165ADCF|nr:uncharacterized protein LOC126738627 [Anthonomus grandis grandis]
MENTDCSAKRELIRSRPEQKPPCRSANRSPACRKIGGVIIPPPTLNNGFGPPQVLQKTALIAPDNGVSFNTRVVEVNDQAAGISHTCARLKDYRAFDQNSGVAVVSGGRATNPGSNGHNALSQTQAIATRKFPISRSGILYTLHKLRDPVAEYQETRGVPRDEEITFLNLITSLCSQAYSAAITIMVMVWNLMPLVDGLVYFLRFFLDKIIDIVQTENNIDRATKIVLFFAEITVIMLLFFLIMGLIFMPVYELVVHMGRKVLSLVS